MGRPHQHLLAEIVPPIGGVNCQIIVVNQVVDASKRTVLAYAAMPFERSTMESKALPRGTPRSTEEVGLLINVDRLDARS
jgi:hypothetical protein